MTDGLHAEARHHLRTLTGDPTAEFRAGQLDAIGALVEDRRRVLVVERTGWGKSAVYFIATRMLRDRGFGASFLVSPLIALMANQVEAAARMGLQAAVVNSTNHDHWDEIRGRLEANEIDLLLVSEQRLNNPAFRRDWMPELGSRVGLVVVDEVHCISDWGHDFRPHYRRIGGFLELLPDGVPVIGCTATANDRVVADVQSQLGRNLLTIRGPLGRDGLRLEVHTDKRHPDKRLAWLAHNIPQLPGTGIVYCLVRRDVEIVAGFLRSHGIKCGTYMGGGDLVDADTKAAMLSRFLANDLKCVVATSALGMGYDKPDVGFVIHYQVPQSAIAYYQQVGRAGRALQESYGILLAGAEDRDIQDWFISTAFPTEDEVAAVLRELEDAGGADDADRAGGTGGEVRAGQIAARVNISTGRLDALLTQLEVEGAVAKGPKGWSRTDALWQYPRERVEMVDSWRREEQAAMEQYLTLDSCRMQFLRGQLDDPVTDPCGICDVCTGSRFGTEPGSEVVADAGDALRHDFVPIQSRKRWPTGLVEPRGTIPVDERAEVGWCLTEQGESGWGPAVRKGLSGGVGGDGFAPELVDALVAMCRKVLDERVEHAEGLAGGDAPGDGVAGSPVGDRVGWVAFVASQRRPELVSGLAREVGQRLGLPVHDIVRKVRPAEPQAAMHNSATQVGNIWGAFELAELSPDLPPAAACLLIDDTIGSRWTATIVAGQLRRAGSGPVVPIALAHGVGS